MCYKESVIKIDIIKFHCLCTTTTTTYDLLSLSLLRKPWCRRTNTAQLIHSFWNKCIVIGNYRYSDDTCVDGLEVLCIIKFSAALRLLERLITLMYIRIQILTVLKIFVHFINVMHPWPLTLTTTLQKVIRGVNKINDYNILKYMFIQNTNHLRD